MVGLVAWVGVFAIVGGQPIEPNLARSVVVLGHCSGALIAGDAVLTSAHCLDGALDHIVTDRRATPVVGCERHPAYQPGLSAHDIGYCRLAVTLPGALPLDDAPQPAVGTPVSLAGFGASSAFSREKQTLRRVTAAVVEAREGQLDVGSSGATACGGDSGGPMLVQRAGHFRVAGVIHGAKGAICASPTEVVPVASHRDWLLTRLAISPDPSDPSHRRRREEVFIALGSLLFGAVFIGWMRWHRTKHQV
jgi:hypothetical protein